MHELSIVLSIVDIASNQAKQANAAVVEEIELEIGKLSGVETGALDFAWKQAVKGTVLENARRIIHQPEAKARCLVCDTSFMIEQYYDPCPACGGHFIDILQGKELRVKSLVVS